MCTVRPVHALCSLAAAMFLSAAASADVIASRQFTFSGQGFASFGTYRIYLAFGDLGLPSNPPPPGTISVTSANLGATLGRVTLFDDSGGGLFNLHPLLTNGVPNSYNVGITVGTGRSNAPVGEPALFGDPSPWPLDLQGATITSITANITAVTITPIALGGEPAHQVNVTFTLEFNGVPTPAAATLLALSAAAAARRRRR